jgi:hypothetical protein
LEICDRIEAIFSVADAVYAGRAQEGSVAPLIDCCDLAYTELGGIINDCLGRMAGEWTPDNPQEAAVLGALQGVAGAYQLDFKNPALPQLEGLRRAGRRLKSAVDATPLRPVSEALADPEAVAASLPAPTPADTKTDKRGKSNRVPQNPEVCRLINKLRRELKGGRSQMDVALELTEGNKQKAVSLLRQARRHKHLWMGP